MFEICKSAEAFKVLKGHGSITEVTGDTLKEVRKPLDADVDFKTAKTFIKTVKEEALGREVSRPFSLGNF